MNGRQLSLGFPTTKEFEKLYAYKMFKQFPELKKSIHEIDTISFTRSKSNSSKDPLRYLKDSVSGESLQHKSTSILDDLSKSSLDEISVLSDFRKSLLVNRRKEKIAMGLSKNISKTELENDELLTPLQVADRKLAKISLIYNNSGVNNHLAGFHGSKLTKLEFNILLRRCLNINLRNIELDALFDNMDIDGSGLIDGVEFIRYFFTLGNKARRDLNLESINKLAKSEEELKRNRRLEEERIKQWESSQIRDFTPEESITAYKKLTTSLLEYDVTDPTIIAGFHANLTPYQFKLQLEKSFKLKLTGSEIGALIHEFSTLSGEYCIDGEYFMKKMIFYQKQAEKQRDEYHLILKKRKEKAMKLYKYEDCLPKILGR